jgi:hypothetical protein
MSNDFMVAFYDFRRFLPEWFGPFAYGIAVFAIVAATLAVVITIGVSPSPHSVTTQSEAKQIAARAPVDTPETAPELSPVYPTQIYSNTASTGQAELARKLAREGKVTLRTPQQEERQPETNGFSPRGFFFGGGPKR